MKTKKNNSYFLIIIFFGIILISLNNCTSKENAIDIIKYNVDSKQGVKTNIKIKSIIKLQTKDDCLIGNITRLVSYNNNYYILDRLNAKALFIFNKEGQFIAKTDLGKGPGELISPWDFYIEKEKSKILIWDQNTFRMLQYDLNLNYITQKVHESLAIRNFVLTKDDNFFVFAQSPVMNNIANDKTTYYYLLYSNDLEHVLKKMFPYPHELTPISLSSPISFETGIKFLMPFDPYIYSYDYKNRKVHAIYKIDLGKRMFTKKEIDKGLDYLMINIRNGKMIGIFDRLIDTPNYIAFNFWSNDRGNFIIHSKATDISYYSKQLTQDSILPKCVLYDIVDNEFICVVEPADLISFVLKNKKFDKYVNANNIKLTDNPYIIRFVIAI